MTMYRGTLGTRGTLSILPEDLFSLGAFRPAVSIAMDALAGTAVSDGSNATSSIDTPQSQLMFLSRSHFVPCCIEPGPVSDGIYSFRSASALADHSHQARIR
jgi:hypothetical protein